MRYRIARSIRVRDLKQSEIQFVSDDNLATTGAAVHQDRDAVPQRARAIGGESGAVNRCQIPPTGLNPADQKRPRVLNEKSFVTLKESPEIVGDRCGFSGRVCHHFFGVKYREAVEALGPDRSEDCQVVRHKRYDDLVVGLHQDWVGQLRDVVACCDRTELNLSERDGQRSIWLVNKAKRWQDALDVRDQRLKICGSTLE